MCIRDRFDVVKKYVFSIDSINKVLIIQDLRKSPDTKEFHFDQLIYEIPLVDLGAGSFKIAKDADDADLLNFTIGTIHNKLSINWYFLRYDEVVAIQVSDLLGLGQWPYSKQLESDFKSIILMLKAHFNDKANSTKFDREGRMVFKYTSSIVTAIGAKDSLKAFTDGYYYPASLESPPYYSKNQALSDSRLKKDLKSELKRNNIQLGSRAPVFIRVGSNGKIESTYFPDLSFADNKKIDINQFELFNPGKESGGPVKSKYLLILN